MAKKQAVLLIHGIGEQRPMETLRGFVKAVWQTDDDVKHQHAQSDIFSKPDNISGSYELRRLTTTKNRKNIRTDFFEYYWAHLMDGNTLTHTTGWVKVLLGRSPAKIPQRLKPLWWGLILAIFVVAVFAFQYVLPDDHKWRVIHENFFIAVGILLPIVVTPIMTNILGDAARYLNPAPNNIKRREEIRKKGIEILNKLHESGKYDRIIVVGHSLGSVIGYDILNYSWVLYNTNMDKKIPHPVLTKLENDLKAGKISIDKYRDSQKKLTEEFGKCGVDWLVTDFVTLGSPLTYADLLLAKDAGDLNLKQDQRELATCPPKLEDGRFSYPTNAKQRIPHHASVFGPTKWTNLYFPSKLLLWGDMIGGPLQGVFGSMIEDKPVYFEKGKSGFFSHTKYWKLGKRETDIVQPYIEELRNAVNLLNKPQTKANDKETRVG